MLFLKKFSYEREDLNFGRIRITGILYKGP